MDRDSGTVLSIIIPTFNRSEILGKCLRALSRQSVPAGLFEVIISDDGSTDGTREVARDIGEKALPNLRYLWQPNSGASAARNKAIMAAGGRILLIINDDTIATRTMLEKHLRAHELFPAEHYAVLGRVTIADDVPYSPFARMHLDASFNAIEGRDDLDWRAFFTCNLSVKRSFLVKYGLFEEKFKVLHEDLELGHRLSRHGLKVLYRPDALGYHHHFIDEDAYFKSALQDGRSLAIWYKKAPHLGVELASLGFYRTAPFPGKLRYAAADLLINRFSIPFLQSAARVLSGKNEAFALKLYSKIYQSMKRKAIRDELCD